MRDVFICLHLSDLQQENELLQALDDKSKLHNEACEACTAEEIRLLRLEEHIIHAQEEVTQFQKKTLTFGQEKSPIWSFETLKNCIQRKRLSFLFFNKALNNR